MHIGSIFEKGRPISGDAPVTGGILGLGNAGDNEKLEHSLVCLGTRYLVPSGITRVNIAC